MQSASRSSGILYFGCKIKRTISLLNFAKSCGKQQTLSIDGKKRSLADKKYGFVLKYTHICSIELSNSCEIHINLLSPPHRNEPRLNAGGTPSKNRQPQKGKDASKKKPRTQRSGANWSGAKRKRGLIRCRCYCCAVDPTEEYVTAQN